MNRIRLTVGLCAVLGAIAMVVPAAAAAATYTVTFQITKGKYWSNYSCQPGCDDYGGMHSFHETDENVHITTIYKDLVIPRKGSPKLPLAIRGERDIDAIGNWDFFGSIWTESNSNAPFNCHGLLFNTSTESPKLISTVRQTAQDLNLDVESGDLFQPKSVSGTNCDAAGAAHWHAFYPATFESPGDGYLPDMLTARVSLPLARLRHMHRGDIWGITFHQGRAKRLPPASCNNFTGGAGGSCTQSLHWTGHLSVTRTG